jgi:hypothetical protein
MRAIKNIDETSLNIDLTANSGLPYPWITLLPDSEVSISGVGKYFPPIGKRGFDQAVTVIQQ